MSPATDGNHCIALVTSKGDTRECSSDVLLENAFQDLGINTRRCVWDDMETQWAGFTSVLVRTCWDYHLRHDEFVRWILWHEPRDRTLINSPTALVWNSNKQYLLELAGQGLRIPESRIAVSTPANEVCFEDLCESFGSTDLIVKPLVSASAYWTWRTQSVPISVSASRLDWLIARGGALVQRYIPEIESKGELSLIFCGDHFLHAVRKSPAAGDFRTQPRLGATTMPVEPSPAVYECARAAYQSAPGSPCYARADVVDAEDGPILMELELIEPELFLDVNPPSALVIAEEIAKQARP